MKDDRFAVSHGAKGDYLGMGLLYYWASYITRAKLCVCLGSGSGFVPKLMRQAQRDLSISSQTILIDAQLSGWGDPDYHGNKTNFTEAFSDVQVIRQKTSHALGLFEDSSIDYLHIDADHSYRGVRTDFENYYPKVRNGGLITLHDTVSPGADVKWYMEHFAIPYVNFNIANGTALVVKP